MLLDLVTTFPKPCSKGMPEQRCAQSANFQVQSDPMTAWSKTQITVAIIKPNGSSETSNFF